MKREIFCETCAKRGMGIDPLKQISALDAALAAQEQIIKKRGTLRGLSVCDMCGVEMYPGTSVMCQSIVVVGMGQHYFEWEGEYINEGK